MANKRISQLPFVGNTGYTATDIMPIVNYDVTSGTTKHTPILDFKSYILSGLTDNYVTGATYSNGILTIQQQGGNISVSGFTQPFTGNTSGDCITDLYISNLHGCSPITIHDSVQYTGSTALGVLSVAEGNQTIAYGDYSHTEGYKTRTGIYGAYLVDSIVDGVMTLNSSYGNIAFLGGCFGNEFAPSKVIIDDRDYDNSIGRGRYTVTGSSFDSLNTIVYLDDSSLNTTNAIILPFGSGDSPNPFDSIFDCWNGDQLMRGDYSHAEGEIQDPYLFGGGGAIGLHSHTEGLQGTSTGNYSHAEGVASSSLGIGSHAEGYKTTASGDYSHSEGFVTLANKDYSHSEGNFTWADGPSSHAEGVNTYSSGYGSHAEGKRTESSGDYSHTEGYETTASGYGSHAEGDNTTASGYGTHSEGKRTTASGYYTHAEGRQTTASGYYTHAEGAYTTASGYYTHSEGFITLAGGSYSHAEGLGTRTELSNDILAEYIPNTTHANHSEGRETLAIGGYSHAEGYKSMAFGYGSHAEGGYYTVELEFPYELKMTGGTSYGYGSHAEGLQTITYGVGSHTEGRETIALGYASHAEGYGTVTDGAYQHAQGMWNVTGDTTQGALILGNGTDANNRSNLIFAAGNEVNISGKTITTNFQMTSGAINGYVLTSDVSGNASWQASTGGGGTFTYEIGQYVASEGGVIFHRYLDGTTQNYLVVAITDQSTGQAWDNVGSSIGSSAQSLWNGLNNSNAIVGQVGFTNGAALTCLNYSVGLINDWYLPSLDELFLIFKNRFNINKTLSGNSSYGPIIGATEMGTPSYWSSTETNSSSAWSISFQYGYSGAFSKTGATGTYVRAVRNFSI